MKPLEDRDPHQMGPYELLGRLGEGGYGIVYLAKDAGGRLVAVKTLLNLNEPRARTNFLREARHAKRVARYCTAQVLDVGTDNDRPYVVSEYIEGPTLHDLVTTEGPRFGGALERLAVNTATALLSIHRAGLIHRDFKPSNVIMGDDGPRVIDFGIARAIDTITPRVVGTPHYMAPEQWSGETVSQSCDMWAWAATAVFAACGRPPFGTGSIAELYARIRSEEPDIPVLDEPLRSLVRRCLNKVATERPDADAVFTTLIGP